MADFHEFYGFRIIKPERKKIEKTEAMRVNPFRTLSTQIWRSCSECRKLTKVRYQNRYNPENFVCEPCMRAIDRRRRP